MAPGAMTGMTSMLGDLDLADLGSGLSAFSQIGGGIASFAQSKKNASMLKKLGIISAEEERTRTTRVLGAQQAAAAASGIDPTSGSALDVQAETALEGEIAALMAKFDYDSMAAVVRGEGTQDLIGGFQSAAGTILGGQLDKLGQDPRTRDSGTRAGGSGVPEAWRRRPRGIGGNPRTPTPPQSRYAV